MSGNLAVAQSRNARRTLPDAPQPRPVEIVPTAAQRRSRPRMVYSAIVVGGLFVVLLTQLLVSIALADGAYQISALQAEQKELSRQRQAVSEQLNVLASPQNLASRAGAAGLVSNGSAVYLDLSTGSVVGAAIPSTSGADTVAHGALLIPNSLIEPPRLPAAPVVPAHDGSGPDGNAPGMLTPAGAPEQPPASESVASQPNGLPVPTTH